MDGMRRDALTQRIGGKAMTRLALAAALGASASVAAVYGCSPVQPIGADKAAPLSVRAPEHPGFTSAASPREWERWWRSHRRPRSAHSILHLHGRAVPVIADALLPGWQYPCTAGDLEQTLGELPPAWTARLTSIRLTFHPEWDAHARTDRARIEISYVVDKDLHAPGEVMGEKPEELQFGARIEGGGRGRYFAWPDRDLLRAYIMRHILVHELGHHVAPAGLTGDQEEDWAEAFAFRYFTPAARRVATAH